MRKVTLYIESPDGQQTVSLNDEISIGRTNMARIVVNDASLSRLHATVFREGDAVWVADENSSNGTFVAGERVAPERKLKNGDEIRLGNNTRIYVEIEESRVQSAPANNAAQSSPPAALSQSAPQPPAPVAVPAARSGKQLPLIPLVGGALFFFIIIFAVAAILIVRSNDKKPGKTDNPNIPPQRSASAVIPARVMDPLGAEDPDDLDDLISSWEAEEKTLDINNVDEIQVSSGVTKATDLKVSREFWQAQLSKALQPLAFNEGLQPPAEMMGRGVPKQTAKLKELIERGNYKQPLDFADLAELRLRGVLTELPMATESYVLDVGGSAGEEPFTTFDFEAPSVEITPAHPKYKFLKELADNFDGQKYDLNNGRDRRQMRIRLLRMYNANSRPVFEEICRDYFQKFRKPLRITSLTRSMDYQISLNKTNANSFRVSGKGSLPPHTSGCAFDMSRKNLSNGEQNFLMAKLSELERTQRLDSLLEGSANACFHTFIFPDGKPAGNSPPPTVKTAAQNPVPAKQQPAPKAKK